MPFGVHVAKLHCVAQRSLGGGVDLWPEPSYTGVRQGTQHQIVTHLFRCTGPRHRPMFKNGSRGLIKPLVETRDIL